jgi:hypothetical protein
MMLEPDVDTPMKCSASFDAINVRVSRRRSATTPSRPSRRGHEVVESAKWHHEVVTTLPDVRRNGDGRDDDHH